MDSKINLEHALGQFKNYISAYDENDPKINLKITHTYRVMEICGILAKGMDLPEEKRKLAELIGLLHDIGRFEQLRLTNSFDDSVIPHAKCSLMVLFDQGHLRDFIETKEYDAKLDNFHTKLIESMETMLDVTMEELEAEEVSDYAYETFMDGRPLLNSKRETHLDMWVSYIGYMFDLNLPQSFAYVREHDYINRLVDRVAYKNPKAEQRMEDIREKMIQFVGKK